MVTAESAGRGSSSSPIMRCLVFALLIASLSAGGVACGSSADDRSTPREAYCNSAKLDFGRLIRMASDANAKPRDREAARAILGVFASDGNDWMQGSPWALRPDSRVILRASRSAARGIHVAADDVALVGPLLRVRRYSQQCE